MFIDKIPTEIAERLKKLYLLQGIENKQTQNILDYAIETILLTIVTLKPELDLFKDVDEVLKELENKQ